MHVLAPVCGEIKPSGLSPRTCVCVCADGSENVTSLDLSDFPALADRSRRDAGSNPAPLPNPLAGRAPYGEKRPPPPPLCAAGEPAVDPSVCVLRSQSAW